MSLRLGPQLTVRLHLKVYFSYKETKRCLWKDRTYFTAEFLLPSRILLMKPVNFPKLANFLSPHFSSMEAQFRLRFWIAGVNKGETDTMSFTPMNTTLDLFIWEVEYIFSQLTCSPTTIILHLCSTLRYTPVASLHQPQKPFHLLTITVLTSVYCLYK